MPTSTLDERTFDRLASDTLVRLESALADADDALEIDLAMGVLTVEFEDGMRYVINSHRAARQIWAAAGASAWHFDWTGAQWIASRAPGEELWALVESKVSEHLGRELQIGRG